ncbi:amino acid/amide ABC transporter membrane protein 2, HAAT family [Tistlia consotensis]|uniref:Amino acid/amide ABC transporter membrane protein 2, HAAT family n=1 Tax=Tistlia consotensis USBA 355 TaxID=560819 RepID=A0A1Y6C4U6_9PROT|nr:branched-chain amino acid ABC transporter permease [Tistlia consotensis]SMF36892.1 amino acid/amide ABC transporter membrane protein 2, HAAT family [Tistlia consotensis USBA 355]SNR72285.1 amino acid/amide ABC transporter membrane protein 2, HAAT family [Tistlia consotensis]
MRTVLPALAAVASALTAPLFLGPYGHYLLCMAAIYAMVALSLGLLLGLGGQISIGHAGFWAVGAYGSAILVQKLALPFLLSLLASGLLAGLVGLLVALPALRVRGHYLAIATLGFSLVIVHILYEWDGLTGGRQGMFVSRPSLFGHELGSDFQAYYLILAVLALFVWIVVNLRRSLGGLSLSALRLSDVAAQSCGVNRAGATLFVFALSAAITGVSGAFYGAILGQLSTDSFTLVVSLSFLTMAIVGGLNSVVGALLGGIFLAYAPEVLRAFEQWQMFIYGALLVAFMHFLPDGLASLPRRLARIGRRGDA